MLLPKHRTCPSSRVTIVRPSRSTARPQGTGEDDKGCDQSTVPSWRFRAVISDAPAITTAFLHDARAMLPHIPQSEYPGHALVCELYLEAGIRAVEIGSVMFGKHDPGSDKEIPASMELVRLAIPRRVYTQSHIDYVVEAILNISRRRDSIRGMRIVYQAPFLRHFTARFEMIES